MLSSHQKRQILGRLHPAAAPQGLRSSSSRAELLALCAAGLLGLVGCGQKGPLYLPSNLPSQLPGNPAAAGPAGPASMDNTDNPNNDLNNNPAVTR